MGVTRRRAKRGRVARERGVGSRDVAVEPTGRYSWRPLERATPAPWYPVAESMMNPNFSDTFFRMIVALMGATVSARPP